MEDVYKLGAEVNLYEDDNQTFDRVIYLDQGRVVESGDPEQIFNEPEEDRTKSFLSKIL